MIDYTPIIIHSGVALFLFVVWSYTTYPYSLGSLRRHLNPGPRFNIKMTPYQYRKSHCGDKTILRPSFLQNGISYTGKMTSLYNRIRPQEDMMIYIQQNTAQQTRVTSYGIRYTSIPWMKIWWTTACMIHSHYITIRKLKDIQRIPLYHDLTLNNGKWVIFLIWWWY